MAQRFERGVAFSAEGAFIHFDEPFAWDDELLVEYEGNKCLILPSLYHEGTWWDLTERRAALIFEMSPHDSLRVQAVFCQREKACQG
jgi:hypothetical protein